MVLLREKRTSSEISEVKFEIRQSVSQIKGLCGIGQEADRSGEIFRLYDVQM